MSDRPPPASGRPTPVRVGAPRAVAPAEPPAPRKTWTTAGGAEWSVEVVGRARTGGRGTSGADLLLLVFRPVVEGGTDGPSETGAEVGGDAREVLAVADSLDDLPPDRLDDLLSRARSFAGRTESDPAFFEGTRRGRRG